jgi:hypothetical protein
MRSHRPFTTRAATVAAAALAAGALTGLAGTSAYAASGTSAYTCTFPVLGALPVPMTATIPDLPTLPAGTPIRADSVSMDMVLGVPDALAAVLPSLSGLGISDMSLDGVPGGIPIKSSTLGSYSAIDHSMPATAKNDAFTLPAPGTYPLSMPSSFDLIGTFSGSPIAVPCTTDTPAGLGTLTTTEAPAAPGDSITTAKVAKRKIVKGKRAKVITTVAAVTPLPLPVPVPAQGEVRIKDRRKTVGTGSLDPTTGAVTIKTLRLKRLGRHVLKVRYLGSDLLNSSLDKVVVKVVKRR